MKFAYYEYIINVKHSVQVFIKYIKAFSEIITETKDNQCITSQHQQKILTQFLNLNLEIPSAFDKLEENGASF
jgi:hypothetical protein